MTFQQFDQFFDKLIAESKEMRNSKGKEYAHDADRFANFKRLAKQLDVDPLLIWWVYTTKHLDSIVSYIKDGKTHSTETIRGRFVDIITYMSLGAGIIEERENNKREPVVTTNSNNQVELVEPFDSPSGFKKQQIHPNR